MTDLHRYEKMFTRLDENQEIAWIPFIMLGYPDIETSVRFIETFIENGADAMEIGLPFSDPVADGVLIQESATVALKQGACIKDCLEALKPLREKYPDVPFGLLTYANLVYKPGLENFYANCHQAGIDSVLIADVPLNEGKPFVEAAAKNNVDAIFIAPPNASNKTLESLSEQKGAYTYVVSRPGVTGDSKAAVIYPEKILNALLEHKAPAPILGFGISNAEHVNKAMQLGFKGAISGSAITRIIRDSDEAPFEQLKNFSLMMKAATARA